MTTKRKQFIYFGLIFLVCLPLGVLGSLNREGFADTIVLTLLSVSVLIFTFNFSVRKMASFKGYFTSRYNFLTEKIRLEKTFELPVDLLFDKVVEVINDSEFELKKSEKDNKQIFAISKINFNSWGENIYFEFESKGDQTLLKFCSAAIYGFQGVPSRRSNWDRFMQNFEASLII